MLDVLKIENVGAELIGIATYHDSCAGLRECKIKEDNKFLNAVDNVQNDLNNLAAIIQEASNKSLDKNVEENRDIQRKHTFDEEDDTSKQATQDYDLHDNEQEVRNFFPFSFLFMFINASICIDNDKK